MAKWADYLISQVLYDQNHIITKVKQHRDIGNKMSGGEIVDRDAIANNLGHGVKYMTVYGDLGKIRMGKNVRYYRAYEDHYIRIDDNKVMTDNLGELPGLVEPQQEEKPALAETKPKPVVETKPLSKLSSAFFSEQVEAGTGTSCCGDRGNTRTSCCGDRGNTRTSCCGDRGNTGTSCCGDRGNTGTSCCGDRDNTKRN